MGIISRFKDIMAANINALLDKAEDPEKMIDQYLRNLESDLAKVKQETASVMAEEAKAKRQLDECTAEVAKMQSYAEKAVLAGNDEDAKRFLMKKKELVVKQTSLQDTYNMAAENAAKMRLRLRLQLLRHSRRLTRLVQAWTVQQRTFQHLTRWKLKLTRCLMKLTLWQSLTARVSIHLTTLLASMTALQLRKSMMSFQH